MRVRTIAIAIAALAIACLLVPSAASAAKDKTVWLCKPGLADNPCKTNLDTAQVAPDGSVLGTTEVKSRKPKVDCFYVYPTVSDDEGTNADLQEDPEERSIALYQAARYAEHCRIYAPLYRQITLEALFSGEPITDEQRDLGYNDVVAAWKTYLRKYNDGRGVILIGHSQGTYVLRQLIRELIDDRRSVRERLVSAILLGGNATVGEGGGRGGDFEEIKPCRRAGQSGCALGFSAFNAPVPADARFGRPGSAVVLPSDPAKTDILCTNPAALGGGTAPLDLLLPTEPFAPGSTIGLGTTVAGGPRPDPSLQTDWFEMEDSYSGRCDDSDDADVLQTAPLGGAPAFNATPDATWGLHLVDANIALGNLLDVARNQIKNYLRRAGD